MKRFLFITLLLINGPAGWAQSTLLARNVAVRSDTPPARDVRISLNAANRPLDQLLKDIERQSGYTFLYSTERLRAVRRTMTATNQSLQQVLTDLITPLGMTYELVGRQIILRETDPNGPAVVAERTVGGRVTATDSPDGMPGVNVSLKGSSRGTVTDRAGRYSINIPDRRDGPEGKPVLVFSFVGYERQEVSVGTQSTIDVQLKPDDRALNEVQVVAFGEQRTRDVTGSIAGIKAADIRLNTAASPDVALQGRAAGVQITQAGGTPGGAVRINVRGVASINSNAQPLIVIDGVPVLSSAFGTGGVAMNPLAEINPNDIESMEVLKDASASVLFGSRAANGVILITTKRGASGKPRFDVGYEEGVSSPTNRVDFVDNGADLFDIYKRAARNTNRTGLTPVVPNLSNLVPTGILRGSLPPSFDSQLIDSTTLYNGRTNWLDQVLRQGRYRQASLSVGAGGKRMSTYVSGSYRREDGIVIGQSLERVSGRVKLDFTPVRWLQGGINLSANGLNNPTIPLDNSYRLALSTALPAYPVQLPDGSFFNGISNGTNNAFTIGSNPIFFRNNYSNQSKTFRSTNTAYLQLQPLPGLTVRTEAGYDYQRTRNDILLNPTLYPTGISAQERNGNGRAENRDVINQTTNINNLITYQRNLGKDHALKLLVGNSVQSTRSDNETYVTENVPEGARGGRDTARTVVFTDQISFRFVSYFGRVNYAFRDKYLLEASLRTDGSSRFGPGNRWATFPSVSAGWVMSDEAFLRSIPALSFLKLRASYGLTGNAEIGNFSWQKAFTFVGYNAAIYGGIQGGQFTNPGNRDLSWESTRQFNAGLDFGLLGNRISGTVDYYDKVSDGLLLDYQLGPLFGTINNVMTINLGSVRNRGVEFSITTKNIQRSRFKWTTNFNIANNQNRVLSTYTAPFLNYPFQFISTPNIAAVGYPLGTYYLPQFAGFDPVTGNELFYERDRSVFANTGQTVRTGNLWDGTINNQAGNNQFILADRTPYPIFFGGLNNTFQFGAFDLSALIYFQYGNWIYDQGERAQSYPALITTGAFQTTQVLRRNIPGIGDVQTAIRQDDNVALNRLAWGSNARTNESTRFLHNGSFARLKNIQIGYNLPTDAARKLRLRTLRVFVTGQNLLTLTRFNGWDPEVFRNGGPEGGTANLSPGLTNNDLPQVRTYVFGLNVGF
ncbi:SusC/RagA family TonB-linked outer membrane protein [Spirosoma montaniterrae]|uniref:SusC/RagA family TonB-linked outer membrane protein n=1 Tax=Spirosoma montaniterrae TaxID=1178516 RepID=A0A1P9WSA7_9BACT|nr:TonB-dependent receptor [Spirosoma montaniterrae]AQG78275.1 SusC/RagA family TonB-linked outer membrane protein [Spirosoma montaniterrae]